MGSSAKKKKEKAKDFQKTKLKVGKAKAKAANFTDTSFRSKSIVVNQQSLTETAPDAATQFRHNLSLASSSRSDSQRRDALAYLTSQLSSGAGGGASNNPVGTVGILTKLLPLISDPAGPVRAQLLKLFRALPPVEVRALSAKIILFVRVGITNLSSAVRDDALSVLEWLLDVAGEDLVASPGGWLKTLNGFGAILGWAPTSAGGKPANLSGWTSAPKTSLTASSGATTTSGSTPTTGNRLSSSGQAYARQITALSRFLDIGLRPEPVAPYAPQAFWDNLYRPPAAASATLARTNPFGHLNIFGAPRDEDSEMYADREDRQRVFARRWQVSITKGIDEARKEGGAVGRAAATLRDVLDMGMKDYDTASDAMEM